jgi:dihydroxy-acid dehydratase
MEAGKTVAIEGVVHAKLDLIDAMIASANEAVTDEQLGVIERRPARPAAPARACSPPTR